MSLRSVSLAAADFSKTTVLNNEYGRKGLKETENGKSTYVNLIRDEEKRTLALDRSRRYSK